MTGDLRTAHAKLRDSLDSESAPRLNQDEVRALLAVLLSIHHGVTVRYDPLRAEGAEAWTVAGQLCRGDGHTPAEAVAKWSKRLRDAMVEIEQQRDYWCKKARQHVAKPKEVTP